MTFSELAQRLGINNSRLTWLIKQGLPWTADGRRKAFDPQAVDEWLLEHGYAAVEEPETDSPLVPEPTIARTYAELANALAMQAKNAERILQRYAVTPGFPGKPGTPGKRDGWFPVEEIRAWIAARQPGGGLVAGGDDELATIRKRIAKLQLEREELDLLKRLGRLADVEDVVRFSRQCVANAKSVLEPLADELLDVLPRSIDGDVRKRIHQRAQRLVDQAWDNLAQMVAGDEESNGLEEED